MKRKQQESLLEKQRAENMLLQGHLVVGNGIATMNESSASKLSLDGSHTERLAWNERFHVNGMDTAGRKTCSQKRPFEDVDAQINGSCAKEPDLQEDAWNDLETAEKAKIAWYESNMRELRTKLTDVSDHCARQLIAERRKCQEQAAQFDAKLQEEFELFEQHHRHEITQLKRDYESRLARLGRELDLARSGAVEARNQTGQRNVLTCEQATSMDDNNRLHTDTALDGDADSGRVEINADLAELQTQLGAASEQKQALQLVLGSVLRSFVRIKQTVLPKDTDSDFESCLTRLCVASNQCDSLIETWTDELIAALSASRFAKDDVSASHSKVDEVERLARCVAELRSTNCELEFRLESREQEFAKQLAEKDATLAEREAQIDVSQRNVRSLRSFVDELLVDREAEREEHARRVSQLENALTRLAKRTEPAVATNQVETDVDEDDEEEVVLDGDNVRQKSDGSHTTPLNSTMNDDRRTRRTANEADEDGIENEPDTEIPFFEQDVDANESLNKLNRHAASTKQLELSIGLYDELLTERNEEVAFLNRRIEQLSEEIERLKEEKTAACVTHRDAAEQTDIASAASETEAQKKDCERGQTHTTTLTADVQALRNANNSLRLSLSVLQSELADKNVELQASKAQIATLESELEKMVLFNESLTRDFDDVQGMLEHKQTELERAQDEADERLQQAVNAVTVRYETLLNGVKRSSASDTFSERDEELYVLEDRIRELQRLVASLQNESAALRIKAALPLPLPQLDCAVQTDQLIWETSMDPDSIHADCAVQTSDTTAALTAAQLTIQTDAETETELTHCSATIHTPTMTNVHSDSDSDSKKDSRSVATRKNDSATLETMQRYHEQLVRLVADWSSLQTQLSNTRDRSGQTSADTTVKEMKRRLDSELDRAAHLDAELRCYFSWKPITNEEQLKPDRRLPTHSPVSNCKHRDDAIGNDLPPLLRSRLQLADAELFRCLETIDNRLRQERVTREELLSRLEAERLRLIDVTSALACERSHNTGLKLELQTARSIAEDVANRLETETMKRKQQESLLEKQRAENMLLQGHLVGGNGIATMNESNASKLSLDGTRTERILRNELDHERRKRTLLETELDRSRNELRTKRCEFEELFRKLQGTERSKVEESIRLRKEVQRMAAQKDSQVDELRKKLSETERQLTDAYVQARNHEAVLRDLKSRVEFERERAVHLETTSQQLRTRLHTTLRTASDERASLLAQLEREKAAANRRIHAQTTFIEQLTQSSPRLVHATEARNGELEPIVDDLYKRLQRAETHRRSLAYQKRYLSSLLNTCDPLSMATNALDKTSGVVKQTTFENSKNYKFSVAWFRFRSGARVVIATYRLNKLQKHWENVHFPVISRMRTIAGIASPRASTNASSNRSSFALAASTSENRQPMMPMADAHLRHSEANVWIQELNS